MRRDSITIVRIRLSGWGWHVRFCKDRLRKGQGNICMKGKNLMVGALNKHKLLPLLTIALFAKCPSVTLFPRLCLPRGLNWCCANLFCLPYDTLISLSS